MTDKPLKAPDIAEMAGVSAGEMKRIAEEYKAVIPSRVFGRVKLYEQKAAGIVEKISSMEAAGKATADIIRELGGKVAVKSTKEKTGERIRKKKSAPDGNDTPPGKTQAQVPSRGRGDETAFIELKLNRLTNRVEQLEKQLLAERAERIEERKEYLRIIAEITEKIDATGKWIDYFDIKIDDVSVRYDEFNKKTLEWIDYTEEEIDLLKKPFWKRRR